MKIELIIKLKLPKQKKGGFIPILGRKILPFRKKPPYLMRWTYFAKYSIRGFFY